MMTNNDRIVASQPLFVHPHWQYFEELLQEMIDKEVSSLLQTTEMTSVVASQNRIRAYKYILGLPEEARNIKS